MSDDVTGQRKQAQELWSESRRWKEEVDYAQAKKADIPDSMTMFLVLIFLSISPFGVEYLTVGEMRKRSGGREEAQGFAWYVCCGWMRMDNEGQRETTKASMISTSALTFASDLLLFQSSVCPLSKARSTLHSNHTHENKFESSGTFWRWGIFGLKIKVKLVGVRTKHTYWEDT